MKELDTDPKATEVKAMSCLQDSRGDWKVKDHTPCSYKIRGLLDMTHITLFGTGNSKIHCFYRRSVKCHSFLCLKKGKKLPVLMAKVE